MPDIAESRATGEGTSAAWRPPGRPGGVKTSGPSIPASRIASSEGTANSGVPKNTTRIRSLRGLGNLLRVTEFPEGDGGPDSGGSGHGERQARRDAEEDPGARPSFPEAVEENRKEDEKRVHRHDHRAPVLLLLVRRGLEHADVARQALEQVGGRRGPAERQQQDDPGRSHRGCRSTSSK